MFSGAISGFKNTLPIRLIQLKKNQRLHDVLPKRNQSEAIVLWLSASDLNYKDLNYRDLNNSDLDHITKFTHNNTFASASLLDLKNKPQEAPTQLHKLNIIWPRALPGAEPKHSYRARACMRSRNVKLTHELEQLNTFFTLNVADYAIHDLLDRYSHNYFIEIIERITENTLNPGLYKTMSLGPEQRFAVKNITILEQ